MRPLTDRSRAVGGTPGDGIAAAAIFAATFCLRWITLGFDNDYFMHLAWGAQLLRGEQPVRDFVEPGFILQTLLAYGGFSVGGNQLIAEGVIVCGFIATGAMFVYLAVRRCGGGMVLAVAASAVAVLAYPRAYAYPKAFVYPAAMWAIASHARRPARQTLLPLAIVTAIAFLFRHDHALWIAGACGIAMVIEYWPDWRRFAAAAALCTGVATVIVAPWVLWVTFSGHALAFVDNLFATQSVVTAWHVPGIPLTVDRQAPLISVAPVEYPRIAVRWASSLSPADRARKEQQFGLQTVPGSSVRYRLTDISAANIRALIGDSSVEDTNDIERNTQRLRGAPVTNAWVWIQKVVPIVRLRLIPGVLNPVNALPLFNWITFVVPWIALVLAVATRWRSGGAALPQQTWPGPAVIAFALLGIAAYHGLVRGSPDSRLGDVAAITGVLVAFVASTLWTVRGRARLTTRPVAVLMIGLAIAVACWYGRGYGRLSELELATVTELSERMTATRTAFAQPPLDAFAGPKATGLDRLARWLHDCTDEQSRVSVVGFEPQIFVLAERRFAAGLSFIYEGWSSSERNQQLAIDRWSRERVPVVISVDSTWEEFSRDYPLLRRWIDDHYRVAARSRFDGNKPLTVFVDTSASPVRTHAATDLPCFR